MLSFHHRASLELFYLITYEYDDSVQHSQFLPYEIPFTIRGSSQPITVHVLAKTLKVYPNGLILESEVVRRAFQVPVQCSKPSVNLKGGTYYDSSIRIAFLNVDIDSEIYYSLDSSSYILSVNNSMVILNDGRSHNMRSYQIGKHCYQSESVEVKCK